MRLALFVTRTSQFPVLESTARAACARGHAVTMILDTGGLAGGPKADQVPVLPERWRAWVVSVVRVDDAGPALTAVLAEIAADALLEVYAPGLAVRGLRAGGWRGALCHVQGVVSDLMTLDPEPYDRVYTWSPRWARLWTEWPERTQTRTVDQTSRFRAVGFPVADLLNDPPLDSFERFGILPEIQVVVYAPFPASTLRWHWWSHGVYTKPWPFLATERRIVAALRAYCHRVGALFVVKGLHRRGVEPWIQRAADVTVWDDVPGEPTLLRLLQSTDCQLLVHHLSTSVSEAAVCGVPAACIVPPKPEWLPQYAPRLRCPDFAAPGRRAHRPHQQSFYDWWPGAMSFHPTELVGGLPIFGLKVTMSPEDTKAYREAFFGTPPYRAGERIVGDLEKVAP